MPMLRGDSREIMAALMRAGLFDPTARVAGVIIDIRPHKPIRIMVEHYADERLAGIIDAVADAPHEVDVKPLGAGGPTGIHPAG